MSSPTCSFIRMKKPSCRGFAIKIKRTAITRSFNFTFRYGILPQPQLDLFQTLNYTQKLIVPLRTTEMVYELSIYMQQHSNSNFTWSMYLPACGSYHNFLERWLLFTRKLRNILKVKQEVLVVKLNVSQSLSLLG